MKSLLCLLSLLVWTSFATAEPREKNQPSAELAQYQQALREAIKNEEEELAKFREEITYPTTNPETDPIVIKLDEQKTALVCQSFMVRIDAWRQELKANVFRNEQEQKLFHAALVRDKLDPILASYQRLDQIKEQYKARMANLEQQSQAQARQMAAAEAAAEEQQFLKSSRAASPVNPPPAPSAPGFDLLNTVDYHFSPGGAWLHGSNGQTFHVTPIPGGGVRLGR